MQKFADIHFQDNTFFVMGNLDFSNVMTLYQQSLPRMRESSALVFDFSELASTNSAVFALIIEWVKFAKRHNKTIHFVNLSRDMLSIAKTAGMDKLLLRN